MTALSLPSLRAGPHCMSAVATDARTPGPVPRQGACGLPEADAEGASLGVSPASAICLQKASVASTAVHSPPARRSFQSSHWLLSFSSALTVTLPFDQVLPVPKKCQQVCLANGASAGDRQENKALSLQAFSRQPS